MEGRKAWIDGKLLNRQGIKPKKGKSDYNTRTGRFWDFEMYCGWCLHEAYHDSDWGAQLFKYCPYCGTKMENGGENE